MPECAGRILADSHRPAGYLDFEGLCYNGAAVESLETQTGADSHSEVAALPDASEHSGQEDALRYCPVCSKRLESLRCKLICNVCGYYMSCADYY